MTAASSNATPPITKKERELLDKLLGEPWFVRAYDKYKKFNSEYHVPYFAGSNKSGTTVYFDPLVPNSVKDFIARHEIIEGILIRHCKWDYDKAHKFATESERTEVESALGTNWKIYQEKLAPLITKTENAPVKNLPPDLLEAAYSGTKFANELKGNPKDPDRFTKRRGSSRDDRTERDDI